MTEFQVAWAEWLALSANCDEETFDRLSALEDQILDHRPQTLDDARRILDVILAQSDPRSDEKDVRALRTIRSVILAAVDDQTRRNSSRAAAA